MSAKRRRRKSFRWPTKLQRPDSSWRLAFSSDTNRQNGSPEPIFESDNDRTWFRVRLPVHERASRAATEHETEQDKSLKNKKKSQDTPQDTVHETIHETIHVTEHVERLISIFTGEMNRPLQDVLGINNRSHFVEAYLGPALKAGLIEMTLPGTNRKRKQSTTPNRSLEQIKRKKRLPSSPKRAVSLPARHPGIPSRASSCRSSR